MIIFGQKKSPKTKWYSIIMAVQLGCTVCETSGIFVDFFFPHCETALRYQNAEAAGTARWRWSHCRGEAGSSAAWQELLEKHVLLVCSSVGQTVEAQTICSNNNKCSQTGDSWQANVAQHKCVFVYNLYIHVYKLSVVKVHVYSFVNMYICVYIGLHEVI